MHDILAVSEVQSGDFRYLFMGIRSGQAFHFSCHTDVDAVKMRNEFISRMQIACTDDGGVCHYAWQSLVSAGDRHGLKCALFHVSIYSRFTRVCFETRSCRLP
jgi:hypothetical protein